MKLQPEQVAALGCCGERLLVSAGRDRLSAQRSTIGMREINVRSGRDSQQQPRTGCDLDAVPSYVRRLNAIGKSRACSMEGAQTAEFGSFVTAIKHPLQAETDSQHRLAVCNRFADRDTEAGIVQRQRCFEVADAGNNQPVSASDSFGIGGGHALLPEMLDRLHHRGEVPRAVINDGDHSVILSGPALKLALASRRTPSTDRSPVFRWNVQC